MAVDALTTLGALIADQTRASVLVALMDGRARTPGELARHTGVAPSTMSQHLARLVEAGVVEVAVQGRHRYVRLVGEDLARTLEGIGALDLPRRAPTAPRAPAELGWARSCYDHLAGRLAVDLHAALVRDGHVTADARLTASGRTRLAELGVATDERAGTRALRPCLDWTERRDHLAGRVAADLFTALLDRHWLVRGRRPRAVRVTREGRRGLVATFGLDLPPDAGAARA
ncbi:ArsR/SmtB family transcription factor [Jatrophihabitans fulvus]